MSRIKIDLPDNFSFQVSIPIRITDLNHGGHVGNDTILSLIHEARVQWLMQFGYKELDLGGIGLIMNDAGIEYKAELFHGDIVIAHVSAANFSRMGFDVFYKLEKESAGKTVLVAKVKTGMICYDYEARKIGRLPEEVRRRLEGIT